MSTVRKTGFSLHWSPEWNYEDEASGKGGKLTASYEDDADGWQDRLPAYDTGPPADVGAEFAGFFLQSRRAKREAGDKVVVTLSYESVLPVDKDPEDPEENVPIPRYSMAVSLGEEPILTHERYLDLPTAEKIALKQILSGELYKTEEGKEKWSDDVASTAGLEVLAKIEKGTTAHREPGVIWRERKRIPWASLADECQLSLVRRINAPPGGAPVGGDRNYMYLGPQFEQDESGQFADLERSWELSGVNGWDPDLYAAPV